MSRGKVNQNQDGSVSVEPPEVTQAKRRAEQATSQDDRIEAKLDALLALMED